MYSNFPFQALDTDRDNIKFVFENGVFHNSICAREDYQLTKDHRNGVNRFCSDLSYHKYLQNILKRSSIMTNFSSIPHAYLTYNQLKKELNHYRDTIKKLKLDNLNYKRTIDSLKTKETNFKRFLKILSQNDYENLSQIISVCLNQKKGVNGIIEKLIDCSVGSYRPRNKESSFNSSEDLKCKLCSEKVNLIKMRDHISKHITQKEVEENALRCGFCGLNGTCSLGIKYDKAKGSSETSSLPESNCSYFKSFNLKCSNKSKNSLQSNRPIECSICKEVIWSLNLNAHLNEKHSNGIQSENEFGTITDEYSLKNQEVLCKTCNSPFSLSKMRDHVAKHIIVKDLEENANRCGFCGLIGCNIDIKITSGKGKNATYGPASSCDYYRKFNLKSSTRPTKSSPSTNRPIECHICKKIFWSYNIKSHFGLMHQEEIAPHLITDLEREYITKP